MNIGVSPNAIRYLQFTHPVWDVTENKCSVNIVNGRFNPRTPCGMRPAPIGEILHLWCFNPRTPCGMRLALPALVNQQLPLQSTHPVWDATNEISRTRYPIVASIHAPRVGCDLCRSSFGSRPFGFNPRTPCGMRRLPRFWPRKLSFLQSTHPVLDATGFSKQTILDLYNLQSTHPVRDATFTIAAWTPTPTPLQSTHPVRDATNQKTSYSWNDFNPRTPCGMRPSALHNLLIMGATSIHAPREGCDGRFSAKIRQMSLQSTHPVRDAT